MKTATLFIHVDDLWPGAPREAAQKVASRLDSYVYRAYGVNRSIEPTHAGQPTFRIGQILEAAAAFYEAASEQAEAIAAAVPELRNQRRAAELQAAQAAVERRRVHFEAARTRYEKAVQELVQLEVTAEEAQALSDPVVRERLAGKTREGNPP